MKALIAAAAMAATFSFAIPNEASAGSFSITVGHESGRHTLHRLRGAYGGGHGGHVRHGHRGRHGDYYPHRRPRLLSFREIRRSLRYRDFHRIKYLDQRRGLYHVRARGPRGRKVFMKVDGYTGSIVRIRPLRARHAHGYDDHRRHRDSDSDSDRRRR